MTNWKMKNCKKKNKAAAWSIIDYCLNRFCPPLTIAFLLWSNFEPTDWRPYCIMGLFLFAERFHFNIGYSVAFCEKRGLINDEG